MPYPCGNLRRYTAKKLFNLAHEPLDILLDENYIVYMANWLAAIISKSFSHVFYYLLTWFVFTEIYKWYSSFNVTITYTALLSYQSTCLCQPGLLIVISFSLINKHMYLVYIILCVSKYVWLLMLIRICNLCYLIWSLFGCHVFYFQILDASWYMPDEQRNPFQEYQVCLWLAIFSLLGSV